MHEFQRVVARAHRQVYARQAKDDDDETTTARRVIATTDDATTTPAVVRTTASTTAAPNTSTAVRATAQTTTSLDPLINLSSILGITSVIPTKLTTTTSSSSSSSSSSLPTTTSSSTSSTPRTTTTSSSSTQRQVQTLTATLTSSNTAVAASASETSTPHSGLSGAETGGIIAGCVLAGFALLIFAIRKTFIQRRKRKRNTWGAGVYPDINDKYGDNAAELPPPIPEKVPALPTTGYLEPRTPIWAPPRPVSPNPLPGPPPAPPNYYVQPLQPSYNNAMMDMAPSMTPVGTAATMSSFGTPSMLGETATVKVLYIPTLPDELQITTGEVVHLLKAYDDGWALCANARGEQGVVPLDCLDRSVQGQANRLSVGNGQQESAGDWRNMKRMSSLSTQ